MAAAPLTRLSFTNPRRAAAVERAAGAYALMFANVGCSTPKQQSAERRSAVRAQNMTAAQPSSIPGSEAEDGQWVRPAKD